MIPLMGRRPKTPLEILRSTELLDPAWYRESHADLRGKPLDAAKHYLEHGAADGRNPSPLFDTKWYLRQNPEVAASGMNPLVHYILYGQSEGRAPRPPFHEPATLVSQSKAIGVEPELSEIEQRVESFLRSRSNSEFETFQTSAYAQAYPDVANHFGKENTEALMAHWKLHGFREGRTPFGYCPYKARQIEAVKWDDNSSVAYYGFFDANTGLGSAARGYLSALRKTKRRIETIKVKLNATNGLYDTEPETRNSPPPRSGGKINIFHINADMVNKFFVDGRLHLLNGNYNIGIWAWELGYFRSEWASAFGALDEIWVPSEFCRQAISAISPIPVVTIPHVVHIDQSFDLLPRSYFRIPNDVFVFGCIFDIGSAMERKNPEAAVRAVIEAFGDRKDVLLAVKYHEIQYDNGGLARLHALAAGRPNIHFYGRTFSECEIISFKSVIDCFVSPHRSEGFGLNVAEALLLKKAVIATNYSGNVDFTDHEDSFPVKYRLVEVGKQIGPYPAQGLWAEPDADDLISTMHFVVAHPKEAEKRAYKGHNRIVSAYSADAVAKKIEMQIGRSILLQDKEALRRSRNMAINFTYRAPENDGPKISIIVPVYNIEASLLLRCIYSVIAQTYQNWELILHDDGSQKAETLALLRRFQGADPRIRISLGQKNVGIADAVNAAVGLSSGEFVSFLDNDDELTNDALAEMVAAIRANQNADMLYSDEDKIDFDGRYCDTYYKPDWSPEHLESVMYLLHFLIVRRSTLLTVGGVRARFSGAQDYDLALRVSRVARCIVHVPKILYHWRKIAGSASAQVDAKPYALQRAAGALQDHVNQSGRRAIVEPGLLSGIFRVRDVVTAGLPVTLVIFTDNRMADVPGRGRINLLDHFLGSILEKTRTSLSMRFLVVDNANLTTWQRAKVEEAGGEVLSYDGPSSPFNFSKKANFALKHVTSELVVLLNDDMEVISADWLDALIELAQRQTTGIVGARLLYPDNRIQHCGIILGINDHVAHIYHQAPAGQVGYNGYTHLIRNYLAVTGACMATRMSIFDEIGGFDESLAVDYNDIDLCLRAYSAGYRNIYTPFAQLYHFEGITQVRKSSDSGEHEIFVRRWQAYMNRDPFYNPNLTRCRLDFSVQTNS